MPSGWPESALSAAAPPFVNEDTDSFGLEPSHAGDEAFLLRAFRSFAEAAGSLERSYGLLRAEVERLRHELEETNRDLAQSLEQNRGMRAYLDRILEGLPCGVLVVSSAGEISRTNPEALRLLGITPTPELCVGLLSLPAAIRDLMDRSRDSDGEHEIEISRMNRGSQWLAVRHALLKDRGNESSIFILHDVSERKRLEAAEARLRREKALAEMSAMLAHEIRNPLGSLELFAGLLAESVLNGEARGWVEHVQAGLRTLAATVNNVLHFHSLPEPERSPVDLGELLDWARDFFRPLARQSHITISAQNRLRGVLFAADRHRLEQVLLNLVLNAVRAMPGGGWIEIGGRVQDGGRSIAITVADTGPGISSEHLPHLFEPGFSTRAASPGLGLAVCHKIAEQHGGNIHVASPPGRGATFTLMFSLTPDTQTSKSLASNVEKTDRVVADRIVTDPITADAVAGDQTGDQA
jgi:two-component system, sensor histidine kinase FlrB